VVATTATRTIYSATFDGHHPFETESAAYSRRGGHIWAHAVSENSVDAAPTSIKLACKPSAYRRSLPLLRAVSDHSCKFVFNDFSRGGQRHFGDEKDVGRSFVWGKMACRMFGQFSGCQKRGRQ